MIRAPKLSLLALALMSLGGAANALPNDCSEYPGLCVDLTRIPAPGPNRNSNNFGTAAAAPTGTGVLNEINAGAFRNNCEFSHMAFDDPIVWPSDAGPNRSHLHTFFGNADVSHTTDITQNPHDFGTPSSTCDGGNANSTMYWVPPMVDVRSGKPIPPIGNLVYYKTSFHFMPLDIQPLPINLRFIVGDATGTTDAANDSDFNCKVNAPNTIDPPNSQSIQGLIGCEVGSEIWQQIFFPQCIAVDGELPSGSFNGTTHTGWEAQATITDTLLFKSTSISVNIPDENFTHSTTGPALVVFKANDGSNLPARTERWSVTFSALTEGQTVTIGGKTWTAGAGGNTAEEVAVAFSGGSPVNDSPDHKSHAAHSLSVTRGCPSTHPYVIPHIRYTIEYAVTDDKLIENLRLTCDTYEGPGGYCEHADWRHGWRRVNHLRWLNSTDRLGLDSTNKEGTRDENNDPIPGTPPVVRYLRVN